MIVLEIKPLIDENERNINTLQLFGNDQLHSETNKKIRHYSPRYFTPN